MQVSKSLFHLFTQNAIVDTIFKLVFWWWRISVASWNDQQFWSRTVAFLLLPRRQPPLKSQDAVDILTTNSLFQIARDNNSFTRTVKLFLTCWSASTLRLLSASWKAPPLTNFKKSEEITWELASAALEIVLYLHQKYSSNLLLFMATWEPDWWQDRIDELLSQMFGERQWSLSVLLFGSWCYKHRLPEPWFQDGFPNLIDHQIWKDRGKERTRT